jgi:predicted transposase/invertase (TIGR01784 family)
MSPKRTLVSFDWAIKHLLKNKADYVVLEGFLATLLGREIEIKSLNDAESEQDSKEQKFNRVDVWAEESDGTQIIIEVQFTPEMDYFHRMLFGSSKALVNYFKKGERYSTIKKVYSVNVVYFDLGTGKDYIYHGTTTFRGLHYDDELELSPRQKDEFGKLEIKDIYPEFYILKVNRFKNVVKSKLDEWMYFLKNSEIKRDFGAPGLLEADERLEYSRLSPEEKLRYDRFIDMRTCDDNYIYTAKVESRAEGRAEGLAEGKAEGELVGEARGIEKGKKQEKIDIARQMKAEGMSVDLISKVTGLSKDELFSY